MAGVTTLTVSLPSLIEELKNHVSADKAPQLDRLLSQARDNPTEHAQVKRRMGEMATADQLRAAVNALIEKCAAAPVAAPAAGSSPPVASASSFTGHAETSELPPELLSLFGDMPKEDFRARLIHAFHCRTPSCPVPGCVGMTSKLERLHTHVSSCSGENCVLCRIWTYLKYYRDSMDQAVMGGAQSHQPGTGGLCQKLYVEPLLQSSQLLPRWKDGQIAWVTPREALSQLHELTSSHGMGSAADGGSPREAGAGTSPAGTRKRQKREGGGSIGGASSRLMPPPAGDIGLPQPWGLSQSGEQGALGALSAGGSAAEHKDLLAALEAQLAESQVRCGDALAFTRYCFTSRLMCTNQPSLHPPRPPALPTLVQNLCTNSGQYMTLLPSSRVYAIHHTIIGNNNIV